MDALIGIANLLFQRVHRWNYPTKDEVDDEAPDCDEKNLRRTCEAFCHIEGDFQRHDFDSEILDLLVHAPALAVRLETSVNELLETSSPISDLLSQELMNSSWDDHRKALADRLASMNEALKTSFSLPDDALQAPPSLPHVSLRQKTLLSNQLAQTALLLIQVAEKTDHFLGEQIPAVPPKPKGKRPKRLDLKNDAHKLWADWENALVQLCQSRQAKGAGDCWKKCEAELNKAGVASPLDLKIIYQRVKMRE